MGNRQPYYCWLDLKEEERVKDIREQVWGEIDPIDAAVRSEPHITVVPGFTCDRETVQKVAEAMKLLSGRSAVVEGVSFWPELDDGDPYVVTLSLDAPLSGVRGDIEQLVVEGGGSIDIEPVPPHVTLFKTGDSDGENSTKPVSDRRGNMERLDGALGGWELTFSGFGIKPRS